MGTSPRRISVYKPSSRIIKPNGLIPLHATLKGSLRWQVLDERGVPEVPRTPSGVAIGPAEGITQSNLITNYGLNSLAVNRLYTIVTTGTTPAPWRRALAVGTGSTAPAFTDVGLVSEVESAASSGAFSSGSTSGLLDTTTNEWVGYFDVTRLITMSADRNLTEFGFRHTLAADSNMAVRELFRDGGGVPITVSLLAGKIIRVDHRIEVRLPAPASGTLATINRLDYDATNTLVATVSTDVLYGAYVGAGAPSSAVVGSGTPSPTSPAVFHLWEPTLAANQVRRITSAYSYVRVGPGAPSLSNTGAVSAEPVVRGSYVPDSFQITKRATIGVAAENAEWHGAYFGGSWTSTPIQPEERAAWNIIFVSPATYLKQETDTIRFGFLSTWARA